MQMLKNAYFGGLCLLLFALSSTGCGPAPICQLDAKRPCQCATLSGQQTCIQEGYSWSACSCQSTPGPNVPDAAQPTDTTPDQPIKPDQPTPDQAKPDTPPTDTTTPDQTTPDAPPVDTPPTDTPTPRDTPNTACPVGQFAWQGQCYSYDNFCTSQTGNSSFPIFSAEDQQAMQQPFVVEFETATNRPLFCRTKEGYYYLKNLGYGICDNDKDGWINIFANQAATSTDPQIFQNARCQRREIEAIVYVQDGQQWQENSGKQRYIQKLKTPVALVETDKNDGLGELLKMPIYRTGQEALPITPGNACKTDADCTSGTNTLCYIGHCVSGYRFKPTELNTFTKACLAGIDMNDNQLDDASETPKSIPSPKTEFAPLLKLAYYVELFYGYYQTQYTDDTGKQYRVWVVAERKRQGTSQSPLQLALRCGENPQGFQPDHWRRCGLRDDQQCDDPNKPGQQKPGLSKCWMPDVKRALPSLFKCVAFDSSTDKTKPEGFFHPDNYGFTKNYTRTKCDITGSWKNPDTTSPHKRDFVFDCKTDANQAPDPTKKLVGWACVSFKRYNTPKDYLAGCIDEIAHQVCGQPGGPNDLTYLEHEKDSYGLARANRECGSKLGVGVCRSSRQVCSGGRWTYCGVCDSCPQHTPGQKTLCPGGKWQPMLSQKTGATTSSCSVVVKPSTEICDGLDNDCDGMTDEGIPTVDSWPDKDRDGFGDKTAPSEKRCRQQVRSTYVLNNTDCDDNNANAKPGAPEKCDGVDTNCDGVIDDNLKDWYPDIDKDGFGAKTAKIAFRGCLHQSTGKVCTGKNTCTQTAVAFASNNSDCCDGDANANPGQTRFSSQANACGNFDWDCDGKETPQVPICQCSKSLEFTVPTLYWSYTLDGTSVGNPAAWGPTARKGIVTLFLNTAYIRINPWTITSYYYAPGCELQDRKITYNNTMQFITNGGLLIPPNSFKGEWQGFPKDNSSNKYLIWAKSQHKTGCHFRTDGQRPTCGDPLAVAAPPIAKTLLSKEIKSTIPFNFGGYSFFTWGDFRTRADFVFTSKPRTSNVTVVCR